VVKLVIDESLPARLRELHECAELCDADGRLGPAVDGLEYCVEPQVSSEELARRRQDPRTYSTEEVKAHLRSL
jgi:hypothetical protein